MTSPTASCPSCGAPVRFRWSGAVQTTCDHCDSILVRHDVDLEKVGEVSSPPPVTSRLRLGATGTFDGRAFTVVGRIAYAWERGHWSEWHLAFDDGGTGWLSDAQEEYAVTFAREADRLPKRADLAPGLATRIDDTVWSVTTLTEARYAGVEGELPFETWDREGALFADLRTTDGRLATLDYSGDEPLLFTGRFVPLEELDPEGLGGPAGVDVQAAVRTLNCPSCGAGVTIYESGRSVNVVCGSCASVLDARSPGLEVLQKARRREDTRLHLPLGATGTWKGSEHRVLGWQERTITVEGVRYSWDEYLLFSREEGFRYLTHYEGHWNDVVTIREVPERSTDVKKRPVATFRGTKFRHFQKARATTTNVLGEWPWEVRFGDEAMVDDYIAPPRMLSSEATTSEVTWSLGEYTRAAEIWEAFGLEGEPRRPYRVFADQPSPHQAGAKRIWGAFGYLFVGLLLVLGARYALWGGGRDVLRAGGVYRPEPAGESVRVLGPFTLDGRPSNLQVGVSTDVDNNWVYFNYSLLDLGSGDTRHFGREVGYWHGRSGGESWSEGSQRDRALLATLPAGEYLLRIEPEGPVRVSWTVELRRDVRNWTFYIMALAALLLPPLVMSLRHLGFEARRWAESDYAE